MFVDKVIDFDNVIAEFNEFSINSKDEDKLKKYYNKKLKEFRKVL